MLAFEQPRAQPRAPTDISNGDASLQQCKAGFKASRQSSFEAGSLRLVERVEDLGDCLKLSRTVVYWCNLRGSGYKIREMEGFGDAAEPFESALVPNNGHKRLPFVPRRKRWLNTTWGPISNEGLHLCPRCMIAGPSSNDALCSSSPSLIHDCRAHSCSKSTAYKLHWTCKHRTSRTTKIPLEATPCSPHPAGQKLRHGVLATRVCNRRP
jgi:hypothetical protein